MPSRFDRFQRLAFLLAALGLSAGYAALGLLLVLAGAIWEGFSTRQIPWHRGALDAPFLSFLSVFLISGLVSPHRTTALGAWVLAVLTVYLGYGMLHRLIARDPRILNSVLRTWAVGGIAAALWAVLTIRGVDRPAFVPELDQNALATALVMSFFMGIWLFFMVRGIYRLLIAAGLVGVVATLTFSWSRGAWVGLVAGLVVFFGLASRRYTVRAVLLVAALGIAATTITGPHPLLLQKFHLVTSFGPNRDRIALADSAIAIFRDYPVLGTGLGTFSLVHMQYKPQYAPNLVQHASAHNIFLNMAAEGGLLGVASFAWIVLAGLHAGLRWVRYAASAGERLAGAAVAAGFVGVLVHQLFDATILAANLGVGFWFLIGIQAARGHPPITDSSLSPEAAKAGTSPQPSVLIVSNGYGEDAAGMALARRLQPAVGVVAFPLVGSGAAYAGVILLEPRRQFPSGGFGLRGSLRTFWKDVRHGTLSHWFAQRRTLRGQRGKHAVILAVGDVYCLWMAAVGGSPVVLAATAKSEYNESHNWLERRLIRRLARLVFTRDQTTADALQRFGIPAQYVGNVLMDTVDVKGAAPTTGAAPLVVLLPGSRAGAYLNLPLLLRLVEAVGQRARATFACALAPSIDLEHVRSVAAAAGWTADGNSIGRNSVGVTFTRAFGDAIGAASIVVGLAGTANEQAVGLGKPVVAFPALGAQFTRRFLDLQQRLLGDALVAARDWQDAADVVVRLLQDPAERARRGEIGRQRMGGRGAVQRIAEEILRTLRAESRS